MEGKEGGVEDLRGWRCEMGTKTGQLLGRPSGESRENWEVEWDL